MSGLTWDVAVAVAKYSRIKRCCRRCHKRCAATHYFQRYRIDDIQQHNDETLCHTYSVWDKLYCAVHYVVWFICGRFFMHPLIKELNVVGVVNICDLLPHVKFINHGRVLSLLYYSVQTKQVSELLACVESHIPLCTPAGLPPLYIRRRL